MNFREGIEFEAEKNKIVEENKLNYIYREEKKDNENPLLITWFSNNNEFEYIYDGSSVMWRSTDFKGIWGITTVPKVVRTFYRKMYKELR